MALIPLVLGVLVVRYALSILEAVRQSMETSPRLLLNEKEDEEAPPPRPPPRPPPQAPPPLPSKALGDEVSPPDEPDRPAHRSTHRKEAMRSRSRATPPMRGSNKRRPLRPPHDERAWSFSSPAQPPHSTRGPFAQRRLGPIPRDFVTTDAYEQWVRGGPHPEIRETEHSRRAGRRAEGEPLEPPMAVRLRRMLYEQQQQQQQQQQQGTGTGGGSPSGSGGGTEPWSRSHGELSERVLETLGLAEALCSGSKIRRSGIARRFMEPNGSASPDTSSGCGGACGSPFAPGVPDADFLSSAQRGGSSLADGVPMPPSLVSSTTSLGARELAISADSLHALRRERQDRRHRQAADSEDGRAAAPANTQEASAQRASRCGGEWPPNQLPTPQRLPKPSASLQEGERERDGR